MNNETPTETAETKNDLLTNYFLGVVNIALFFALSCLFNQPIGGLYLGALWLVVYTGYFVGSAILFVIEDSFPSVRSVRAYYLNRYIVLLFETGLILLAILLVLSLAGVSQINEGISWKEVLDNIITFFPVFYVLASLIAIIAVVVSAGLSFCRHCCDPDYNPITRSSSSKQSLITRVTNAFPSIVIEAWRQIAIFTLWVTFPVLFLVIIFFEDLIKTGTLDFGVVIIVPLIIGLIIIQFVYIIFNLVMRRIYARIWKLNR
ncbi:MAG: hypothetical protein IKS45_12775 [Thermoguttaceae bacterium]|nr:hypothetical protein [Thermoguttaceae bacterium]